MTIEAYNTATNIMKKMQTLNDSIERIEGLTLKDTTEWLMEIRPNNSHPLMIIDHKGENMNINVSESLLRREQ